MNAFEMTSSLALDFLNRTFDAAWIIDRDSLIVFANPSAARLTGYDRDELIGRRLESLLPSEVSCRHGGIVRAYLDSPSHDSTVLDKVREFAVLDRSGKEIPVELMAFELSADCGTPCLGALMHDIRERSSFQRQQTELIREMAELARTDDLTGLLNRRAFLCRLEEAKGLVKRHARPAVVALADVDQFKQINDCHGHDVGDQALRMVAAVLRARLRSEDVVGRLGGDEFGLLFPETRITEALLAAEQVRREVAEAGIALPSSGLQLTVSIGLATLPSSLEPVANVLARADRALYRAKAAGRNRALVCEKEHPTAA